jgi:RHS repeat-associated protein
LTGESWNLAFSAGGATFGCGGLTHDGADNLLTRGIYVPTQSGDQTVYNYAPLDFGPQVNADDQIMQQVVDTVPLTQVGAPSYDGNGNTTSMSGLDLPAVFDPTQGVSLGYDVEDRLIDLQNPTTGEITYGYGQDGMRAWKRVPIPPSPDTLSAGRRAPAARPMFQTMARRRFAYARHKTAQSAGGRKPMDVGGMQTSYYFYDEAGRLLEEDDSDGQGGWNCYGYLWGANGVVMQGGWFNAMSYGFDPDGNVSARFDQTGELDVDFYDAYGLLQPVPAQFYYTANNAADPIGYKGQNGYYTDPETGLICLPCRYYCPVTGRFLTRDPIGYDGGINLYGYCRGNPVDDADPLGLQEEDDNSGLNWDYLSNGAGVKGCNVLKSINKDATIAHNAATFVADLHPAAPAVKALYGKDNEGKKISFGRRLFEGGMAILAVVGGVATEGASGAERAVGGTYKLVEKASGEAKYVGRTANFVARRGQHARDATRGAFRFVIDRISDDYAAVRGREQILYEECCKKGIELLNRIRPVSARNPNLPEYMRRGRRLLPPK